MQNPIINQPGLSIGKKQNPQSFCCFFRCKIAVWPKAIPWCVRVLRGYPLAAWRREAGVSVATPTDLKSTVNPTILALELGS